MLWSEVSVCVLVEINVVLLFVQGWACVTLSTMAIGVLVEQKPYRLVEQMPYLALVERGVESSLSPWHDTWGGPAQIHPSSEQVHWHHGERCLSVYW